MEGITRSTRLSAAVHERRLHHHRWRHRVILPIDAIQEFNTMQNPKADDGFKEGSTIPLA